MSKWPKSAIISFMILLVGAVFSNVYNYHYVRESYRALGMNDGKLAQQEIILKTISENFETINCEAETWSKPAVELATVKTDTLFIGTTSRGEIAICQ
jgi:hypothetical protein